MSTSKKGAIGIDHGSKRTGFAAVDALRIAPSPLETVAGDDQAVLAALGRLLDERDVTHVIIGHPLNMDGTPGPRAKEVDRFVEALRERFPELIVCMQDERLSTKEAEARLREAGHFGDQRKARRDSWSALVLLEDWMRDGEPEG